jgi:hypothetical protein
MLVAVNLALTGLAATPVLGWVPERVTGTGFLEDSRTRVAGALEEYRRGRVRPDDHLGAFVGISNLREAVELRVVGEVMGPAWRLIGVAGAGFGIGDVDPYARQILMSELHPDVVVIGLGLHQLVDPGPRRPGSSPGIAGHLRRGELRRAAIAARNATWIYARRQDVSIGVDAALLELRARLFAAFGVPLSQDETAKQSPWREMVRSDWPDHFSAETLRAQEELYTDLGIFDPDAYDRSRRAFATLAEIIDGFHRRRARVLIVLLPEHSRLRRLIPPRALDVFHERLKERFPDAVPPVLDFREAIHDGGFVDLPHMNRQGRVEFSRSFANVLRTMLPDGPPLMARRTHAAERNGTVDR